jgi:hypothetical protein
MPRIAQEPAEYLPANHQQAIRVVLYLDVHHAW